MKIQNNEHHAVMIIFLNSHFIHLTNLIFQVKFEDWKKRLTSVEESAVKSYSNFDGC